MHRALATGRHALQAEGQTGRIVSDTVVCRSCGTENSADVDFCTHCGEYLRWELTRTLPAVIEFEGDTPPPAPAVALLDPDEHETEEHAEPDEDEESDDHDPDDELEPHDEDLEPHDHDPDDPAHDGDTQIWGIDDPGTEQTAVNTTILSAAVPGVVAPVAAEPQLPETGGAALVAQRAGAEEIEPGMIPTATVDPGARVSFHFLLRNASRIVDNYDLVVAGLPDGWATATPEAAYLMPFGSGGASEQAIEVQISPPRVSASEARVWRFDLIAFSRATGGIAARIAATVNVAPFNAWEIEADPLVRTGRLRGRYDVTVANRGNAPIELWLYATDPGGRLRGRFRNRKLPLSPGESRTTLLEVRPPRPRPLGRPVEYRATLEALPDEPDPEPPREPLRKRLKTLVTGGGVTVGPHGVQVRKPRVNMPRPPQRQLKLEDLKTLSGGGRVGPLAPAQVAFRQKALIPTWLILLALLLAALVALFLLTRNHQAKVPQLVGLDSTFAAQERVQRAGLTLDPTVRRQTTNAAVPGTIIAQDPPAGNKVNKGTPVTIEVAVGTGKVPVPKLKGKTRAEADKALRAHGLSLGQAQPVTAPLTWVVASQIPVPGLQVQEGTPIQVFLKAPPKKKKKNNGGSGGGSGSGGGGSGGGGGGAAAAKKNITVPPINGRTANVYSQAVGQLGLIPNEDRQISSLPAGSLISVNPAPGTKVAKDTAVKLVVSEGMPDIAFDTYTQIQLVDPVNGKPVGKAVGPDPTSLEPSFSPDGQEFVYRSASRVFLAPTAHPKRAAVIYDGSDLYTNVTFSPDLKRNVVAFDRQLNGNGDLCLGTISNQHLNGLCLPDDGWNLGRSLSWSPDGRQILAFGSRPGNSQIFGLIRYSTRKPFSTNPADWHGSVVTDVSQPGQGVIAGAFAPSGKQVALVSNIGSPFFRVVLAKPGSLASGGKSLPVHACEVAWRPDGQEMAVVQSDAACRTQLGSVVRVSISDPRQQFVVASSGRHVAYQGLASAG
jgi:beta-lactam-binding protein with PASTA domain